MLINIVKQCISNNFDVSSFATYIFKSIRVSVFDNTEIVFQKRTDTCENVCGNIPNVESTYLKCFASQYLSPHHCCVIFLIKGYKVGRVALESTEQRIKRVKVLCHPDLYLSVT